MAKNLYIVVRLDTQGLNVCSSGQKPFIGPLDKAKDLANFLKSVNKDDTYEVLAVGASKYKGVITDRYAEEAASKEPKRAKSKVGK